MTKATRERLVKIFALFALISTIVGLVGGNIFLLLN